MVDPELRLPRTNKETGSRRIGRKRDWRFLLVAPVVALMLKAIWPLRDEFIVSIVYGSEAYRNGLRVVGTRPTKFSNGELVPTWVDCLTGFAAVLLSIVLVGFAISLVYGLYRLLFKERKLVNPFRKHR